jgi:Holliday junction resolvase RusA-like endonuclease
MPIPKGVSKKQRAAMLDAPMTKRPDGDNLWKTVSDALVGLAYDDDSQIWRAVIEKRYSDTPRTEIVVLETPPDAQKCPLLDYLDENIQPYQPE